MQISTNITPPTKRLILSHILRSSKVLRSVYGKFEPEYFNGPGEEWYQELCKLAFDYWEKYRTPVPQNFLVSKILESGIHHALVDEDLDELSLFVDEAYEMDIAPSAALDVIQEFIDERGIIETAKNHIGSADSLVSKLLPAYRSKRIKTEGGRYDLLSSDSPIYTSEPKIPSGCTLFDELLNGGIRGGEMYVLLGPSGGGKTTFSLQIAAESARYGRDNPIVSYFSYEQSIHDLAGMVYSCLTGINRNEIEGKVINHDKPEYRMDPDVAQAIQEVKEQVGGNLLLYDFVGKDEGGSVMDYGFGGMEEIDARIYEDCENGKKPSLVIVDWIIPLINRHGIKSENSKVREEYRFKIVEAAEKAHRLAEQYNCSVLLVNQLSTAASSKPPGSIPDWTDSHESKGLSHLAVNTVAIGRKDPDNHCCWMVPAKSRFGVENKILVKLRGEYCKFEHAKDFIHSERGKKPFIRSDLGGRVIDA